MINSHALLPTELLRNKDNARQRPSLTKGNPSLQSALRSLTSVFEMGTGVTFLPSSPHIFNWENVVLSKLNLQNRGEPNPLKFFLFLKIG
jgi:hypothetical protein